MSLFQKKTVEHSQNFTLGNAKTLVIVGLGNPGKEYDKTRHNIGFDCLDALRDSQTEFTPWQVKKNLFCIESTGSFGDTKVILIKPTTFMNESGKSVRAILDYYKLPVSSLTAVHDELDIVFGQIRTRVGGSSAGHNGIKSITNQISAEYGRVRIGILGIKPTQMDTADYVLAKFSSEELINLSLLKREVQSILIELIYRRELYPDTRNFLL
jgi:PTH1 family peptidyl-tRNA hydrolase